MYIYVYGRKFPTRLDEKKPTGLERRLAFYACALRKIPSRVSIESA